MAIYAYDVNQEEIQVFLIMSLIVLGVMIAAGSVLALMIFAFRKTRNSGGLLAEIENIEKETEGIEQDANRRD